MPKNIGESSLTRIFELIEDKVNLLKNLIDGKASGSHKHSSSDISGLANVATSGSYNDLSNKPTIPTIPSSLPANGGNADTVDSKHIVVSSSAPTTNDTSIITFVV